MLRLVITFLLSLSFLFIKGFNHLFARSTSAFTAHASQHFSYETATPIASFALPNQSYSSSANTSTTGKDELVTTELEDEDECTFSRKCIELTNYFLSFFYAQAVDDLHRLKKQRLPVCTHFSYTSSFKYILQRVIRI